MNGRPKNNSSVERLTDGYHASPSLVYNDPEEMAGRLVGSGETNAERAEALGSRAAAVSFVVGAIADRVGARGRAGATFPTYEAR